jgi:hypothetical protein
MRRRWNEQGDRQQEAGGQHDERETCAVQKRNHSSALDAWEVIGDAFCNAGTGKGRPMRMDMQLIAWISIGVALVCAAIVALDEVRHPQSMAVMNVVWPVTALYFSVFGVWAYFTLGRRHTRAAMSSQGGMAKQDDAPPTLAQVAVGTSHCGAGCMLADVLSEFAIAATGITLLGSVLWAEFAIDFAAAWALGVVFQYWAMRPMRPKLSSRQVILAAMKADTLSILAFQVGMYAWMALVYFKLFPGPHLTPYDPRYWLMMQVAMICGFATSLPMNRLLIAIGLKEKM